MRKSIIITMLTMLLLALPVFADVDVFFQDDFNRVDSTTVGNGWGLYENDGTDVSIVTNRKTGLIAGVLS